MTDETNYLKAEISRLLEEINTLRLELGSHRLCVNCGRTMPADQVKRGDSLPECEYPNYSGHSACCFDLTPQEAFEYWRRKAHEESDRNSKVMSKLDNMTAQVAALCHALDLAKSFVELTEDETEGEEFDDAKYVLGIVDLAIANTAAAATAYRESIEAPLKAQVAALRDAARDMINASIEDPSDPVLVAAEQALLDCICATAASHDQPGRKRALESSPDDIRAMSDQEERGR